MKLILVSGDGTGAGKSTLAARMSDQVWPLAGAMRAELQAKYPGYDWFNKTQQYKEETRVKELGGITVRQALIDYGQAKIKEKETYWVELLCDKLLRTANITDPGVRVIGCDDLRKVVELDYFRMKFKDVVHIHVANPSAKPEGLFDNDVLRDRADYVIQWKQKA